MPEPQERSFGEKLNTWVQTVGIILAAAWGIYTFIYKEIIIPKSAPVNVTLDLSMKRSGVDGNKETKSNKSLVAIEMKVAAKNPSSRAVKLLPNVYIVRGYNIAGSSDSYLRSLDKITNKTMKQKDSTPRGLHYKYTRSQVVLIGSAFGDDALKPGEMIRNCITFYVPQGEYDMLEAHAYIPVCKEGSGINGEWMYNKNEDSLDMEIFHTSLAKRRKIKEKLKGDEKKEIVQEENQLFEKEEFGYFSSVSIISLWEDIRNEGAKPIITNID
jgi:hypothetical protein